VCERYRELFDVQPTYDEFKTLFIAKTGGDDGKNKFAKKLQMTFEVFERIVNQLGVEVTPANKGFSEAEDLFLSRNMKLDPTYKVVFPFLKDQSITKALHWSRDSTPYRVIDNLKISILEFGLCSREQYQKGLADIRKIIAHLPTAHRDLARKELTFYTYEELHHRWYEYISSGDRNFAVLDASDVFNNVLTNTNYNASIESPAST
jgi:hypothetical protein